MDTPFERALFLVTSLATVCVILDWLLALLVIVINEERNGS